MAEKHFLCNTRNNSTIIIICQRILAWCKCRMLGRMHWSLDADSLHFLSNSASCVAGCGLPDSVNQRSFKWTISYIFMTMQRAVGPPLVQYIYFIFVRFLNYSNLSCSSSLAMENTQKTNHDEINNNFRSFSK